MTKPTFETYVEDTLNRATSICTQRGTEYKDSWANPSTKMLDAVCANLKVEIPEYAKRAIMLAVLVDVKYNRLDGGYKDDTILDSINYNAALAAEMQRLSGEVESSSARMLPIITDSNKIQTINNPNNPYFMKELRIINIVNMDKEEQNIVVTPDMFYREDNTDWKLIGNNPPKYIILGETMARGVAMMYQIGIPTSSGTEPAKQ